MRYARARARDACVGRHGFRGERIAWARCMHARLAVQAGIVPNVDGADWMFSKSVPIPAGFTRPW